MFGIKLENEAFTEIIIPPCRLKLNGHTAYRFVFGGFMWVFFVSSHNILPPLRHAILRPSGEVIMAIKDAREMQNLVRFSEELARLGR